MTSWLRGVAGLGVPDGTFATWAGFAPDMAGTWSDATIDGQKQVWPLQPGLEYGTWNRPIDIAVGAIFKGEGQTWAAAASGSYDAQWTTCLTRIASYRTGKPTTYIRFGHEFNLSGAPWSVGTSEVTNYITAWRRFRSLQQSLFPSGKLVWCPNAGSNTGIDVRNAFPGASYVDVYGVDSYNAYPAVNTLAEATAQFNRVDTGGIPVGIEAHRQQAATYGLPLAICEWATNGDPADPGQGKDAPVWVQAYYDWLTAHGGTGSGQVLYEVLFNLPNFGSGQYGFYPTTKSPLAAAKYKELWSATVTTPPPLSTTDAIAAATTIAEINTALAPVGASYGTDIVLWTTNPSGSDAYAAGSTLWTNSDLARAKTAATIIVTELQKYPAAFVNATALTAINLVRDTLLYNGATGNFAYSWNNEFWTSTPADVATAAATQNYQRVFHHEFFHVIDGSWTGTTGLDYGAWDAVNPTGFVYGQPWAPMIDGHPQGFIDDYATTNHAEDSAQIHSALMAQPRYDELRSWIPNDPALRAKVTIHHAFLGAHDATLGTPEFYATINGSIVIAPPPVVTPPDGGSGGGGTPTPTPTPSPGGGTAVPDYGFALPTVKVWDNSAGGDTWVEVGQIGSWTELVFAPTFNDVGDWEMTLPFDDQALLLVRDRLITIDWRGQRSTWRVSSFNPYADDETGEPTLKVAGGGALSMLGWKLVWPNPALDINSQPVIADDDPAPYQGPAGTVISFLVAGNLRGLPLVVPQPDPAGLGANVQARPLFDNMLELVTKLAKDSGIGVNVNLVNDTAMRARLVLQIYVPSDRTKSALLTAAAGTLDKWEQADTEPTATAALVGGAGPGGADRYFVWPVTTATSNTAAIVWGGHREVFVDGSSSLDDDELAQAGRQALLDGAETRTLSLVAAEADQMQAFTHYNVGDKATAEVLTGAAVADVITSIKVTVNDSGVTVEPGFGNPAATNAQLDLVTQLGQIKRALRAQERK